MNLILISGAEATCKSDIARRLSAELGCVYLSKDSIKEALYDEAERSTWNYRWYESKAKQDFFGSIEEFIENDVDIIIESNFIGPDRQRLVELIGDNVNLQEIHCYADGMTSFKRAIQRNESGRRHSGHHDRRWYPKIFIQSLLHTLGINVGAHQAVKASDNVLYFNTTRYPNVDFDSLVNTLIQT